MGQDIDADKTPQQLFAERQKRLQDALELKQPDRIPIGLGMGYMLAEIGGITKQELLENPEKAQELLEKAAIEYQPDQISGPFPSNPKPHVMLGDRTTRWPGHGMGSNSEYQFVEGEYMKADDYDDFLEDPTDWAIRVLIPRTVSGLEGFSMLPSLRGHLFGGYSTVMTAAAYTAPPIVEAFKNYYEVGKLAAEAAALSAGNVQRLADIGIPPNFVLGTFMSAPFDVMSDGLRGMRGVMLDIIQRPEKLLEAEKKVSGFQLKQAFAMHQNFGLKYATIPLHRGSDGFISIAQFERFYWPQLKGMMLELVEHDIIPVVIYEGVWDQRLNYLAELPRAKTVGNFQASDIFKVKEVLGDTMCIIGGMPNSLLHNGTVIEVQDLTRKLCEVVGKGGGYIMGSSVGELSGSKPELVKTWVEATKKYGVY